MVSRTSFAMKRKKFSTNSGFPLNILRSSILPKLEKVRHGSLSQLWRRPSMVLVGRNGFLIQACAILFLG